METLTKRMNFTNCEKTADNSALKFKLNTGNHYDAYDNLCRICSELNIDLTTIDDDDFNSATDLLNEQINVYSDSDAVFVWID